MARIVVISLLVIVVYSWEEVKCILQKLVFSVFRRTPRPPHEREKKGGIDRQVGTLVILATAPMGLIYLFASLSGVLWKLGLVVIVLLIVAISAIVSEVLLRRIQYASPLVILFNFISPAVAGAMEAGHLPRKVFAKFAFLMSLPIFAGLLLYLTSNGNLPEITWRLNILITVLVGSLILRITVDLLEHYFYIYKIEKLFSYYRVVLGIVLATILLMG